MIIIIARVFTPPRRTPGVSRRRHTVPRKNKDGQLREKRYFDDNARDDGAASPPTPIRYSWRDARHISFDESRIPENKPDPMFFTERRGVLLFFFFFSKYIGTVTMGASNEVRSRGARGRE